MTDEYCETIVVKFSTVKKLGYGYDFGNPCKLVLAGDSCLMHLTSCTDVCFELATPPLLEQEQFYRTVTGDQYQDNKDFRHRLIALDEAHRQIAPYAHQV